MSTINVLTIVWLLGSIWFHYGMTQAVKKFPPEIQEAFDKSLGKQFIAAGLWPIWFVFSFLIKRN
jgi:hypothetical protein